MGPPLCISLFNEQLSAPIRTRLTCVASVGFRRFCKALLRRRSSPTGLLSGVEDASKRRGDVIRLLSRKASITSLYGNGKAKFRKDFKIRNADFLISLLAIDVQSVDENTHFAGGGAEAVC